MTRLEENWIYKMAEEIEETEGDLRKKTGWGYSELAAQVGGISIREFQKRCEGKKVAVVTMTAGQGEIGRFAGSIQAIVRKLGVEAFLTSGTDVEGLYEATVKGADIVYMADDDRFIALNLRNGRVGENNEGTAKGFVHALQGVAKKNGETLMGQEVLVIGCGPVGRQGAKELQALGARPVCWDLDPLCLESLELENYRKIASPEEIRNYRYIFDACSSGDWMDIGMLHPDCRYATPGVPLSLTKAAAGRYGDQMVHDLLQIGVASMLMLAL